MRNRLPRQICILDVETESANLSNPEKSKLAFVGILPYTLRNGGYYPTKHQCFLPHQMQELEGFLKTFPGIIIGHNIYEFDFRVLGSLIPLGDIIDKTVDTLFLLSKKNRKRVAGLGLDDLSRINLGERKLINGRRIPELWRQGRYRKVVNYNKKDCHLTQKLWLRMVRKRRLSINYHYFSDLCFIDCSQCGKTYMGELLRGCKVLDNTRRYNPAFNYLQLQFSPSDLRYLSGQKPLLTFQEWKRRLHTGGSVLNRNRTLSQSQQCAHCVERLAQAVDRRKGEVLKYNLIGEFYKRLPGYRVFAIARTLSEGFPKLSI